MRKCPSPFKPNSEPGTEPTASNKRRELRIVEDKPNLPKFGNIKIPPRGVTQVTPLMFQFPPELTFAA